MERRSDYEAKLAAPGADAPADIQLISDARIVEAERRRDIVVRIEAGPRYNHDAVEAAAAEFGVNRRQFNRYRKAYREFGTLTCLLPRSPNGGRGGRRLDPRVDEVILEVRREFDRERKEATAHLAFDEIRRRCRQRGLRPPSPKTLRSRYAGVPIRERVSQKYGSKIGRERYEHHRGETPETTFPLERIQIDHTIVDVSCAGTFEREHIGRPWITIALDECSRAVLAFVLTWEYPNASTVAQCMNRVMTPKTEWLDRVGASVEWPMFGTPDRVYLDNAAEFSSRALKYGCRQYGIQLEHRPPGMPQFGGIIERFIGTTMNQMRLLTASTARTRGFDNFKTRNPNDVAEMSIEELERWLLEFICGQYHLRPHSKTKQRPDLAWKRGIYGTERRSGRGAPPIIKDKQKLYLDFSDIEERTIERYGMRWDNIRYWDEVLRPFLDAGEQRKFIVRRNPYDASRIYFLHPDTGAYHELRSDDVTLPSVPVWEYNQHQRRTKAETGDRPDTEAIMASMARQRDIEKDARSSKRRHLRRKNEERRSHGARVVAELTPHPAPQTPAPQAFAALPREVRRNIVYEIDE